MPRIPQLLLDMIATGRWPSGPNDLVSPGGLPRALAERIRRLAPEESQLYLESPPFRTARAEAQKNPWWSSPDAAPHEIDFDQALVIGDFGLGSDAPILLDNREDGDNPRVIRLRWSDDWQDNHWVVMSHDFRTFVETLGL